MITKDNIILFLILILIFKNFVHKEKMTNIVDLISKKTSDIEAIGNLARIADDLTKDGILKLKGNLKLKKLNFNSNLGKDKIKPHLTCKENTLVINLPDSKTIELGTDGKIDYNKKINDREREIIERCERETKTSKYNNSISDWAAENCKGEIMSVNKISFNNPLIDSKTNMGYGFKGDFLTNEDKRSFLKAGNYQPQGWYIGYNARNKYLISDNKFSPLKFLSIDAKKLECDPYCDLVLNDRTRKIISKPY